MISLRAYSRHRGCTLSAVQDAIARGRLRDSVVRDERGRRKIADAERADREWARNTDAGRVRPQARSNQARRAAGAAPKPAASATERPRGAPTGRRAPSRSRKARSAAAGSEPPESLARVNAVRKLWQARLAKLEYERRAAELVDARVVRAVVRREYATARDRLMQIPDEFIRRRPAVRDPAVIRAVLEDLLREALEDLSHDPDKEGRKP